MKICPNCGQSNASESRFCRFCGNRIEPQAAPRQPVRPYAWKTEEFDVGEPKRAGSDTTEHIRGQTVADYSAPPALGYQAGPVYPSAAYRCPRCGTSALPVVERRISAAGWVVFTILLVLTLVFCWVGLLIREDVRVCPVCGLNLG